MELTSHMLRNAYRMNLERDYNSGKSARRLEQAKMYAELARIKEQEVEITTSTITDWYVHSAEDMRFQKVDQIEGQAATLGRIFWAGNLVCNGRRYNGELSDLLTS